MGLNNIVRGRRFRNFMAKLYGWGASVVILGALFKINHYPGADYMLIIGLGTESLIFFFSGFEPPYVEPDWSLVYPELAGLYHGLEVNGDIMQKGKKGVTEELDALLAEAKIGPELIENLGAGMRKLSENANKLSDISNAASATSEYVDNMSKASKSVEELSSAYQKSSETLNKDITATEEHFDNLKNASTQAADLTSVYARATESFKSNLSASESFSDSVKEASKSASELAKKYSESAERLARSSEKLDFTGVESKDFNDQLKKISDNLSALNSVYELQLQGANESVESGSKLQSTMNEFMKTLDSSVQKTGQFQQNLAALNELYEQQLKGSGKQVHSIETFQQTLDQFVSNLNASIEMTSRYKDEVNSLAQNVAALNKVYGNMLSAMNINIKG